MGFAYTIKDPEGQYFITSTVHQWVDVFTRKDYIDIFLDSIRYCQKEKGLKVFAWVIMTNHVHLIVKSDKENLSGIIRDFKKFTATKIYNAIEENSKESRKRWLLWLLRKDENIWFWEEGYHGEQITTREFYDSKVNYIHLNPVRAGFVEKEEEYIYSSCGDFYGTRKGLLELEVS
ncbi:MAG TPA: transposase [Cyclobacteriaceae bacterium]|jgi:REP element-mobilizing transposase RayT|nr:transposase [Cyclobacteriaceae bacterium]